MPTCENMTSGRGYLNLEILGHSVRTPFIYLGNGSSNNYQSVGVPRRRSYEIVEIYANCAYPNEFLKNGTVFFCFFF